MSARTMTHGTQSGYKHHGCRCAECRAAHAAAERRRRAGRPRPARKPRPVPEHGTSARYARGCRCDDCRAARAAQNRACRARQRGVEPTPAPAAPAPAPCELVHASAVIPLLERRLRILDKCVARRTPGAAGRRDEIRQLLAALKRHGVTA